jgi:hypothetical protein
MYANSKAVGMKPQRNEQKKSMNKEIRKIEEKQ